MFCLLAVLLYSVVAQEECLNYQSLSQRTLPHSGDEDGFFFYFYVFLSSVTLTGSQDWGSVFLRESLYRVVF